METEKGRFVVVGAEVNFFFRPAAAESAKPSVQRKKKEQKGEKIS